MTQHSTIVGGSTAGRVLKCPGSVLHIKDLPPSPETSYAKTGTALHECMELLLRDEVQEPDELIGREVYGVTITADMVADKIEPALEWFENVLGPDDFWIEQKVELKSVMAGAFGTADIVFLKSCQDEDGEPLLVGGVADWKFGDGVPVPAENNSQMKFYLQGAIESGLLDDAEALEAHIFQPSAKVGPEEYAKVGEYDFDELSDFAAELREAVATAMEPGAPFCAGSHCNWCPGNINKTCEEITAAVTRGYAHDIKGAPTPEKLAEYLDMADTMRAWLSDLDKLAKDYAEAGSPPPGWKLKESHGHRKYADEKKADGMLQRAGVAVKDRYTKKLLSPAQAEKILKKTEGGIPKNWSKNIDKPFLGYKLVRDSEPGEPAVNAATAIQSLAKNLKIANVKR